MKEIASLAAMTVAAAAAAAAAQSSVGVLGRVDAAVSGVSNRSEELRGAPGQRRFDEAHRAGTIDFRLSVLKV